MSSSKKKMKKALLYNKDFKISLRRLDGLVYSQELHFSSSYLFGSFSQKSYLMASIPQSILEIS